ncbi:hypothetical protein FQN55_004550 [Onygenales sp. PD_40]|nr:hypothetical protein FQN55_004550 [Onygenales sp. PD_40]
MNSSYPSGEEEDRPLHRPDTWRPFASRWAHDGQAQRQPQSPFRDEEISPQLQGPRRLKRDRPLDPTAPSYQPSSAQGPRRSRRLAAGETASMPLGASLPPWRSQPLSPRAGGPLNQDFISQPFTPINPYSTTSFLSRNSPGSPFRSRSRSVTPPPAPRATETYLSQSSLPPQLTPSSRPLLVVLDMNGTLIYRIGRRPIRFKTRPGLENFMTELFMRYRVMVWTSSQPATVKDVLDRAFTKEERKMLVATWARDTLGLTKEQYNEKVQVYKRLDKVWADRKIKACYPGLNDGDDVVGNNNIPKSKGKKKKKLVPHLNTQNTDNPDAGEWNQTNTVLIDDSALKAIAQPYNIIEIPEFTNNPAVDEEKILDTVLRQLRILARQVDVSQKLREWEQKRTELFRSSSLGAQGDHGGEPQSHSKADIEQFWEEQLRLDEEAIARMDLQAQAQAQAPVEANVSPPATDIVDQAQGQHPSTNSSPPAATTTTPPDDAKSAQRRAKNQKRAARRAAAAARNAAVTPTPVDGEGMIGAVATSVSGTDDGGKEAEGGVVLS